MNAAGALQKLLTWLSPAFPVGAFAWSAGLEAAIAEAAVTDSTSLRNWLAGGLAYGAMRTDAVLLAHAYRAASAPLAGGEEVPLGPEPELAELADLCLALTPALERHAETTTTGAAFVIAARAWPDDLQARLPDPCPYPIAVGAIAAAHGIGLDDTLVAYLTAALHAQVSVAVRLVPLGQTEGLRVMAALEKLVAAQAAAAAAASLADLGTIAYAADIAQMRHETLETRLFRS